MDVGIHVIFSWTQRGRSGIFGMGIGGPSKAIGHGVYRCIKCMPVLNP